MAEAGAVDSAVPASVVEEEDSGALAAVGSAVVAPVEAGELTGELILDAAGCSIYIFLCILAE